MPDARPKADLRMEVDGILTVNLVLHESCRGQIIEKMAHKLCAALRDLGVEAGVSLTPSADATVNHFMMFHYVDVAPCTLNTMAVTHVDDALKVDMVRRYLKGGVRAAVCMSSMTVEQLVEYGLPRQNLTYALPAHDGEMTHRRIRIGITSNNYSDGRKRDWLLTRLAEDMPLHDFEFQIFGRGWDDVASCLAKSGAEVVLHAPSSDYEADYVAIKSAVPNFDYYFYPGLDEGSMGTLDALAAGVKTITTLQGFHLDIPYAITHGFWDYAELKAIFQTIHGGLCDRVSAARELTWERYARRHLAIWNELLAVDELPSADVVMSYHPALSSSIRHNYSILGYRDVFRDPFRRSLALQFWVPNIYKWYSVSRPKLGRLMRTVVGKV